MCTQCVAQGAAYAVPGLVALRIWSRSRTGRMSPRTEETEPDGEVGPKERSTT